MKKKNNDYSFIASKFDKEGISADDELSLDAILNKVDNNSKIIKFKGKKRGLKALACIAACIAIIVCSVTGVNTYYEVKYDKAEDVISFGSYHQINALMKRLNGYDFYFPKLFASTSKFDYAAAEDINIADSDGINDALSIKGESFSQTNVQVDAVDEADIVRTDGKYIYFVNNYEITIYTADGKNSKQVGKIQDYYSSFDEIYIVGDRLVAISGRDVNIDETDTYFSSTVSIYDITDRSKPALENKFSQSGAYTSSRMIGDYLYLVSSYSVYNKELPFVAFDDECASKLSYNDIYCMPCPESSDFVVVSAIDINDVRAKTKTKAVIGCSSDIYCSENNLYLLSQKYEYSKKKHISIPQTNIVRVSLDGLKLDFSGKASVYGAIENQYSVDEKDGYLRIATSDFNANNLFVLDDKLNEVGAVRNFAQGESIQAVRYIGDYAYVITFEQTDPLFVIDLSNPEKPQITGSVKITGFSDNLIPVDENTLLGVGYFGSENFIKLALFDISDKNNPQVMDSKVYKYWSDAQNNIKALLINRNDGYFAFAYELAKYYAYDDEDTPFSKGEEKQNGGIITFEIKNSKLKETNNFKSDSAILHNRCVYVDDDIYALTVGDEILVYSMK